MYVDPMVDLAPETLRVWILKAKADSSGQSTPPPRAASIELEELDRRRRENRELKQASEILKLASVFARELDPRHR